jgi:hypothetical protein
MVLIWFIDTAAFLVGAVARVASGGNLGRSWLPR